MGKSNRGDYHAKRTTLVLMYPDGHTRKLRVPLSRVRQIVARAPHGTMWVN